MSCVFQNIDPPPPSPPGKCVPPAFVAGGEHIRRVERGVGGSIFWKTQDTALYSTYIESSLRTPNSLPVIRNRRENYIFVVKMSSFVFSASIPRWRKK